MTDHWITNGLRVRLTAASLAWGSARWSAGRVTPLEGILTLRTGGGEAGDEAASLAGAALWAPVPVARRAHRLKLAEPPAAFRAMIFVDWHVDIIPVAQLSDR